MKSRGGEQPLHNAAALRMCLQRFIGELLNYFEGLAAGLALVFVQRHNSTCILAGDEKAQTESPLHSNSVE